MKIEGIYRLVIRLAMLIIGVGYVVGYILNDYVSTEEFIVGNMWLIASMFYIKDKE